MRKWFTVAMALVLCMMIASSSTTALAAGSSKGSAKALMSKSLDSLAKRIVRECTNSSMSQFEKAVALYDWMIDHTVYRGSTTNPYYVLSKGEASCGGYSNAYKELLTRAKIKSKVIDGTIYGMRHTWNLVYLSGRWYHVDVRMGDHMAEVEGRYRRFGMSNEQALLYYRFRKINANYYSSNYAYKTGQLANSIAYVRNAITTRVKAGEKYFFVDLAAADAPSELNEVFNRITVKNALQNLSCSYLEVPGNAKATLSLSGTQLVVRVKVPTYRVKRLERTQSINIYVDVEGNDFSAVEPLDLSDKILITPSYATKKTLFWKSYREKIAIVDQSGKVKIVGFGKVQLKASTVDGSKLSCSYYVTVRRK